jgi:hypothetical protein
MNTLHPDLERYRADLRDAIETDLERRRSRRRIRIRVVRFGVPGLAVALGASLTLVLTGSQAAFAGWSASPTAASAQETSAAGASCQAQLSHTPPVSPGVTPGSAWSPVVTDVRGPFTLVVYENGTNDATCLTGPSVTVVSQSTTGGRLMSVSGSSNASGHRSGWESVGGSFLLGGGRSGNISHVTFVHLASTSQSAVTLVDGQIDEGVTGVTLALTDGEHVQATTGSGWFVAWWPGSLGATSADITSASGTSTQTIGPHHSGRASASRPHASTSRPRAKRTARRR